LTTPRKRFANPERRKGKNKDTFKKRKNSPSVTTALTLLIAVPPSGGSDEIPQLAA
jgi:hypothetical protein